MEAIAYVWVITFIITEQELFEGVRAFIALKSNLLGYLVQCFFCTSVWVTLGYIIIMGLPLSQGGEIVAGAYFFHLFMKYVGNRADISG